MCVCVCMCVWLTNFIQSYDWLHRFYIVFFFFIFFVFFFTSTNITHITLNVVINKNTWRYRSLETNKIFSYIRLIDYNCINVYNRVKYEKVKLNKIFWWFQVSFTCSWDSGLSFEFIFSFFLSFHYLSLSFHFNKRGFFCNHVYTSTTSEWYTHR